MVKSLVRFGTSVVLGLALALPFMRLVPSFTSVAHAQVVSDTGSGQLGSDDILDPGLGASTGLGTGDLKQTIADFAEVIDGKHDDKPESAFYMKGSIEDVVAAAKTNE